MGTPSRINALCERCEFLQIYCLCDLIPEVSLKTRVVFLCHWREKLTMSNTARILQRSLAGSEIRYRGERTPLSGEGILNDSQPALFLFPDKTASDLDAEFLRAHPGPHTLIVPDGTWGQAGKIGRREKFLAGVPHVKIPEAGVRARPTIYSLRHSPHPYALSTFEATARALQSLEGGDIEKKLMDFFRIFVERAMWMRGLAYPIRGAKRS